VKTISEIVIKMTINEQQKEEIRNGEKARCSICGKIVEFGYSEFKLLDHLIGEHQEEADKVTELLKSIFTWGDKVDDIVEMEEEEMKYKCRVCGCEECTCVEDDAIAEQNREIDECENDFEEE